MDRKEAFVIVGLTLCLALALATYFYVENRCTELEERLDEYEQQLDDLRITYRKLKTSTVIDGMINYFFSHFNESIGLIYESEDTGTKWFNGTEYDYDEVFYIYSDGFLSMWALQVNAPVLSDVLNQTIQSYDLPVSGQFEVLVGIPISMSVLNANQLVIENGSNWVIVAEFHNGSEFIDWTLYGDKLLFQATNNHVQDNRTGAEYYFGQAYAMWDGKGIYDKATEDDGYYANYKLALLLYVSRVLNITLSDYQQIEDQLWSMQQINGGITSLADLDGNPIGSANAETTALSLLLYNESLIEQLSRE